MDRTTTRRPGRAAARVARPTIVGHRGAAALWPENSRAGFEKALQLGVRMFELDVHPSRDGVLAVIHDAQLDRTTTGHGAVNAHDWDQLTRCTLRDTEGERIPELGEILSLLAAAGAETIVEIKEDVDGRSYPGIAGRVLAAIDAAGMASRCRISAFHWPSLVELRRLSADAVLVGVADERGMRASGGHDAALARLAEIGVDDIGLHWALWNGDLVAAARRRGFGVGAWTVNEGPGIAALAALGVDWIITDRPDVAFAALSTAEQQQDRRTS